MSVQEIVAEGITVEGQVAQGFEGVRDAFLENFRCRGEVGASVCLSLGGQIKVDLWRGIADPQTGRPWLRASAMPGNWEESP
jgi:hypothetical protein